MSNDKKIALITGASRGIGREIAKTLANDGLYVVINYNSNKEQAEEVLKEIQEKSGSGQIEKADVSNLAEANQLVEKIINEHGKIDVLVNNAGITKDQLIMRMTEEEFDKVININLKGTFNCIKSVSRSMMKNRTGKIINITSVVGISGNIGQANYAASKAGVIGLTKSLAKELASRGIQVNAVAPGFIETDMTDVIPENIKKEIINKIPLGKLGKPEDIANVVAFLVSEKAEYITGQVITVDGGMII